MRKLLRSLLGLGAWAVVCWGAGPQQAQAQSDATGNIYQLQAAPAATQTTLILDDNQTLESLRNQLLGISAHTNALGLRDLMAAHVVFEALVEVVRKNPIENMFEKIDTSKGTVKVIDLINAILENDFLISKIENHDQKNGIIKKSYSNRKGKIIFVEINSSTEKIKLIKLNELDSITDSQHKALYRHLQSILNSDISAILSITSISLQKINENGQKDNENGQKDEKLSHKLKKLSPAQQRQLALATLQLLANLTQNPNVLTAFERAQAFNHILEAVQEEFAGLRVTVKWRNVDSTKTLIDSIDSLIFEFNNSKIPFDSTQLKTLTAIDLMEHLVMHRMDGLKANLTARLGPAHQTVVMADMLIYRFAKVPPYHLANAPVPSEIGTNGCGRAPRHPAPSRRIARTKSDLPQRLPACDRSNHTTCPAAAS